MLAERIRQNIQALIFTQPKGLSITLSLGVAMLEENESANSPFELADAALYQAKKSRRNRVMIADR